MGSFANLSTGSLIYLVFVGSVGAIVLVRSLLWLDRTTARRKRWALGRERYDALLTETPVENSYGMARDRAVRNIEQSFTVTRRILVPLIVGVTAILCAFPFLGAVPAQFLSLGLAGLTVIIGIAGRSYLENAIAGLVISSSRLINIGDTVTIDGNYGTVEDITTTHTTLKLWDWKRFVVPNTRMLQSTFLNYSLHDKHIWACVEFYVAYGTDIELVERLATSVPKNSLHIAGDESPRFWVINMDKDSVECWVAMWAATPSEAWSLCHDVRSTLIKEFLNHGIQAHSYAHRLLGGEESPWPVAKSG